MTEYSNRGIGVVLLALVIHNDQAYVLCNKRGNSTSEYKDMWNLPSGYLEFNEDTIDASIRETREECGIIIPRELVKEVEHSSDPKNNRQNIIFRHIAILPEEYYYKPLKAENNDEVSEIRWLTLSEIDSFEFAWNQKATIHRIINKQNEKSDKIIFTFGKHKGDVITEKFIENNIKYIEWAYLYVDEVRNWNIKNVVDKYRKDQPINKATNKTTNYNSSKSYNRYNHFDGDETPSEDVRRKCNHCQYGPYDNGSDICDSCRHDPDTGWGGYTDHSIIDDEYDEDD